MTPTGYVVVALNLFCLLPCLILFIGANRTHSKLSRNFMWLIGLNMLGLVSEAASWLLEHDASTLSYYGVRVSLFLTHVVGYSMLGVFGEYLYACFSLRSIVSRRPFRLIWACAIISGLFSVIAMFNELYATFGEANVYQAEDIFFVYMILPLVGFLILCQTMRRYSSELSSRQMAALRWYIGLILFCSAVLIYEPELALHYIVGTLSQTILYINIQMDEAQQRETELSESRTAVMLSQISPHFILNVLNDISILCRVAPDKALQAIIHFSSYLRGNIDSLTCRFLIPFEKELEHVEHYLWLESLRYEGRLEVVFDLGPRDFLLPPLSLQPLVENAVRHGLAKKEGGGTVTVSSRETDGVWQVIVTDDGVGYNKDALLNDGRNHVGLSNVRGRLAAMCGGSLMLESTPGRGTVATIEIPKVVTASPSPNGALKKSANLL